MAGIVTLTMIRIAALPVSIGKIYCSDFGRGWNHELQHTTSPTHLSEYQAAGDPLAASARRIRGLERWGWITVTFRGTVIFLNSPEPPRDSRRLQSLRGLGHEQIYEIFPGSPGVGGADELIRFGLVKFDYVSVRITNKEKHCPIG